MENKALSVILEMFKYFFSLLFKPILFLYHSWCWKRFVRFLRSVDVSTMKRFRVYLQYYDPPISNKNFDDSYEYAIRIWRQAKHFKKDKGFNGS
jgi:hypothetical protein